MPDAPLMREDVIESLELLLAHGFGELTVKISEHKIDQIDALIRKRKVPRAGPVHKQV